MTTHLLRAKFGLPEDVAYLNCAAMAPLHDAVVAAGRDALEKQRRPFEREMAEFFDPVRELRRAFARLIHIEDDERIAIIPSASYGFANAARQIRPSAGSNVVIAAGQFPSNVLVWRRLCEEFDCELRSVPRPTERDACAERWNEALLAAIDDRTVVVAVPPLHWTDGVRFDLPALRDRSTAKGARLIIDGTQWVGAAPFDVGTLAPDAVVCAGYKWLLGPHGTGLAYYGPSFDDGIPIEENWLTHEGCEDVATFVDPDPRLRPKALRYSVGEHPSFVPLAMMRAALDVVLGWPPDRIAVHTTRLIAPFVPELERTGLLRGPVEHRAPHLFGLTLPDDADPKTIAARLKAANVIVSVRGGAIRVSLHLFNDHADVERLVRQLTEMLR